MILAELEKTYLYFTIKEIIKFIFIFHSIIIAIQISWIQGGTMVDPNLDSIQNQETLDLYTDLGVLYKIDRVLDWDP